MFNSHKFLKKCSLAILAAISLASACTEEIPYVIVNRNAIVASQETSRFNILVDSNSDWKAESRADWVRLYAGSGSGYGAFDMVVDANHSASERNSEVVVSCAGCTAVITVVQSSSDLALVTPVTDFYIGADAQELDVEFIVSCNDATVKAFSNTDWVDIGAVGASSVKVSVAENTGGDSRDAEIKVSGASSTGKAVVSTVSVHQGGTDNILDVLVDSLVVASMGETVKIPVQTNADIEAVSSSSWCTATVSDKNVLISADGNLSGGTREAIVTISVASQRGKPLSKAITVTQESVAIGVSIPISEYTIDNAAQDVIVKYNLSSPDFKLEGVSSAKWANVTSVSDGVAVVSVEKNSSRSERAAEIALTATNSIGVAFTARTSIRQSETAKDILEILVPEVNVKAEGESMKIPFNASAEVTAKSSAYWCIAKIDGSDVAIEVSKNVGQAREAFITLTTAGGESGTIKITQSQSADSIDLPVKEVSAKAEACTVRIPYTDKSQASVSSNVDWCSVSIEEGYIVAELEANTDENIREAYITVTTEEGNSGLVHVLQAARGKDTLEVLTPEVNVVSGSSTIRIPFSSNASVDARSSVEWIAVKVEGSDVVASIQANKNEQPREGYITLTTEGGAVAVAHIIQASAIPAQEKDPFLNVVVDMLYAPKEGTALNIPFASSSKVKAVATVNWISLDVDSSSSVVLTTVEENTTGKDRNAFVVLTNNEGLSARVEIIQVSNGTLYVVLTEFTAGYEGGTRTIPYEADGTVDVKTTEDWFTANTDGNGNVVIEVAANDGDSAREGYVVLTDRSGNTAYIHVNQTYNDEEEEEDELQALVTSISFNGHSNSIKLPVTTNMEDGLSVRSSSDWLSGTMDGLDVVVAVEENWSGETRTGYLTVTTPDGTAALITVTQTSLEASFEFETDELSFDHTASSKATLLHSTGRWTLVDESNSIPSWITVSPASGTDDTVINISVGSNKFAAGRSTVLFFRNTDHEMTAKLTVSQDGNPNGLIEFLHLGKGYDVSGKYAEEAYVKAKVLDTDKLVAGDHIADLLTPNQTVEEVVTGKTREEYVENYTVSAGVEGQYAGFTASVETNFSEKALGTQEYSYATLRHMTKKQILKIYENETAADLKDCVSDIFTDDVNKAAGSSGLAAAAKLLVDKYGTHVITGFALGGSLEYSMAADASTCETETNWSLAVKAGFEQEGVGSASTSDAVSALNNLKNEASGFESKLICRGGQSQYTSSGYGENAGKVSETYSNWLTSLEDKNLWVMVDYEGSSLIPLWEFIEDKNLAKAVKDEVTLRLQPSYKPQTSAYKTFQLIFKGMYTTHGDGNDDVTEWQFTMKSKIDRKSSMEDTIYDTHGNDPQVNVDRSKTEKTEEGTVFIQNTTEIGRTSREFKLSKSQSHTATISLTKCYEDDGGNLLNDKKPDTDLTLSVEPGKDYWTYTDPLNNTVRIYDIGREKEGKIDGVTPEFNIYLYPGNNNTGDYLCFIFQLVWKD